MQRTFCKWDERCASEKGYVNIGPVNVDTLLTLTLTLTVAELTGEMTCAFLTSKRSEKIERLELKATRTLDKIIFLKVTFSS